MLSRTQTLRDGYPSLIFSSAKLLSLILILFLSIKGTSAPMAGSNQPAFGEKLKVKTTYGQNQEIVEGQFLGTRNDCLLLGDHGDVRIYKAVETDGHVIDFPGTGARYDSLSRTIFGVGADGDSVSLVSTKVEYVELAACRKIKGAGLVAFGITLVHNQLHSVIDRNSIYPLG